MKTLFQILIVLVFTLVAWAGEEEKAEATVEQKQQTEKAIIKVHENMMEAAENLDPNALFAYVLDMKRGVIIQDGRVLMTRQEALESTKQNLQGLKDVSYNYKSKLITMISPTVALWVAQGTTSATIVDTNTHISIDFAESIIFTLKDKQWKVLHAHRSTPNR